MTLLCSSGDDAYSAHFDRLDVQGNHVSVPKPAGFDEVHTKLSLQDYLDFLSRGLPNSSGTYVISREALSSVGGFDPGQLRANDFDLWLRVIKRATWCYDPHCAMSYRIRTQGNLSADIASRSYFRLRALVRLRDQGEAQGTTLGNLIRYWATQAVRTAATRGSESDWNRARDLASSEIPAVQFASWRMVRRLRRLGILTIGTAHR
jgi:hypothetical protein